MGSGLTMRTSLWWRLHTIASMTTAARTATVGGGHAFARRPMSFGMMPCPLLLLPLTSFRTRTPMDMLLSCYG